MTALFSRWLPCATLTLWSLVMLYYAEAQGALLKWVATWSHLFTGRVDSFLIPQFRPYVLIAGFVLLGMALLFVFASSNAACCATDNCAHPLSRNTTGKWLTFLILVLPVSVAAAFSPDSYSKNVMTNRPMATDASALPDRSTTSAALTLPLPAGDGVSVASIAASPNAPSATPAPATTTPSMEDYIQRTPEGYIKAEVLDLLYAAQDSGLRKVFDGRTIQLIGQLMPETANNAKGHRFKAVRMFMTCCAADARPVSTLVEGTSPPALPEMTWIKIVGTATFPVENGRRTAVIKAEKVEKTEPPDESMLY